MTLTNFNLPSSSLLHSWNKINFWLFEWTTKILGKQQVVLNNQSITLYLYLQWINKRSAIEECDWFDLSKLGRLWRLLVDRNKIFSTCNSEIIGSSRTESSSRAFGYDTWMQNMSKISHRFQTKGPNFPMIFLKLH